MKIITLNTWGGRAGKEKLLSFFKKYQQTTDIFCLQEIWSAPNKYLQAKSAAGQNLSDACLMTQGMQAISQLLSGYQAYFRPQFMDNYGLMTLVKKDLLVKKEGELFVYKHREYTPEGDVANHARNIQYITLETSTSPLTVINFHGLWNGKGKTDSEDRLLQSKNISNFIQTLKGECILCGDFNLRPDTQSIKILEDANLKNLIKEYKILSTRTSLYTKPEKFADYVFVTPNIKVKNFVVLPEEVSDHTALQIEIG